MSDYILSCCSTSDLTLKFYKENNIKLLNFHFFLGNDEYLDDFGQSITYKDFYKRMLDGETTRTTQINSEEFIRFFEPLLKDGMDILHICFSSGLSGTYQSAVIAKSLLEEKYPERKLFIVDSLCGSSGYGLLVYKIATLKQQGYSIEKAYDWALSHRLNVHHWFFSTDLTFFVKGGRLSKTAGLIGNILHLCPIMNLNYEGKITLRKKIIGKKRAIENILEIMKENANDGLDYNDECFISHSECLDDANKLKDKIEEVFKKLKGKVRIFNIGTTIGSHSGPGTTAIYFFGKKRQK